ncbi:MAG: hypothetical protein WC495_06670 [Patescibacteria group bacterium]|jgi:hypothetical protein
MTKLEWQKHITDVTGVSYPGKKVLAFAEEYEEWAEAVRNHLEESPNCPECRDRRRSRKKNKESRIRNQMMRDMGMKKTRSGAWEDIQKYGTREEIEFLLESIQASFPAALTQFKDIMNGRPAVAQDERFKKILTTLKKIDTKELSFMEKAKILNQYVMNHSKEVNDFINMVGLLRKGADLKVLKVPDMPEMII